MRKQFSRNPCSSKWATASSAARLPCCLRDIKASLVSVSERTSAQRASASTGCHTKPKEGELGSSHRQKEVQVITRTLEGRMYPAAEPPLRSSKYPPVVPECGGPKRTAWAVLWVDHREQRGSLSFRLSSGESGSWPNQTHPAPDHLSRPIPIGGSVADPWRHLMRCTLVALPLPCQQGSFQNVTLGAAGATAKALVGA